MSPFSSSISSSSDFSGSSFFCWGFCAASPCAGAFSSGTSRSVASCVPEWRLAARVIRNVRKLPA